MHIAKKRTSYCLAWTDAWGKLYGARQKQISHHAIPIRISISLCVRIQSESEFYISTEIGTGMSGLDSRIEKLNAAVRISVEHEILQTLRHPKMHRKLSARTTENQNK